MILQRLYIDRRHGKLDVGVGVGDGKRNHKRVWPMLCVYVHDAVVYVRVREHAVCCRDTKAVFSF